MHGTPGATPGLAKIAARLPRNGLAIAALVLTYICGTAIRSTWDATESIRAGSKAGLGVTPHNAWASWHLHWSTTAYALALACLALHAFACWARPYPTRRHATLPVALLVVAATALSGCLAVEFAAWMTRPPAATPWF